ncbi:MAG: exosortase/archaeosortase family protein [Nitrospirota bacterium]
MTRLRDPRHLIFAGFCVATLMVFYEHLATLVVQSLGHDTNDYIPLVPLVSAYFFYTDRNKIFSRTAYSFPVGLGTIIGGTIVHFIGRNQSQWLGQNDYLSVITLSIGIIWIGGFVCCYGLQASRQALFPLLFLFFIVPMPAAVMEGAIAVLQESSAEATSILFALAGVPVLREGFVFHLTGMSIEVADECSGIHSAIALLLCSVVAGKLFLAAGWRRVVLILVVFPIAVMKNGLRIVTLTLLGNYVDPRILSGPLHKQGGVPFFLLAISVLGIVMWLLRRTEKFSDSGKQFAVATRES